MLRVPGSECDLLVLKSRGADVRVVYSPMDCLRVKIARAESQTRKSSSSAIGFEYSTAPGNAMAIFQAAAARHHEFFRAGLACACAARVGGDSVLRPKIACRAFFGPGHVCTVVGYEEYEPIAAKYRVPIVVTGFRSRSTCSTACA